MCMMFCEFGFKKDANGCDVCKFTKEPEICSDIQCKMECPFGFEKNEDGCFLCACYLPCASVTCDSGKVCTTVVIPSETDNLLKYRPVCVKKLDCSSKNCDLICPFGFLKDDKGCDLCQCDDPCQNKCNGNQVCRAGSCVNIPNPMSALCLSSYCLVKCVRPTFSEPSMSNQYDCSQCKCDDLCLYEDCGSKKCKMTAETTCILDICFNTTKPKCYDLCPAMDCNQECDYGHHTDSNNCQLCSCFDPCDEKQCGPNAFCSIIDIFIMSSDGTFQKSPKPQVTCNDYIMVHSVLKIMADFSIINPLETALFNLQFSRQIADMLKVKEFDVIIKSIYENILVDFDVRTENKYEEAMVKNNLESIKQRRNFHITYKGQNYDAYFTDSQATASGQPTAPSHTTTTTSYWYLTPGWFTPGIFDWTSMFPTTTTDSYDGVLYTESKPNSSYLYLILLSILIPVGVVILVIMASLLIFLCCIKKKVTNVEQPPVYTNPSLAFISDFNSGLYSSYVPNSGANPVYPPHVLDLAYVSEVKVHPDTIEA
ncbi:hypothetical protein HELRODRAFT_107888 [Helobdella robusta]|uniref:Antistasin-like domain-containing protein n=1 Tax=Helobdella robusta TaxID=6412 RepID=T1EED6_HELRO|nr:hypothetical protein HELRODRAFT_107888 [Helobdella robusta]ESN94646.1 hypothetical protein HELRODRAFT_107888 [Helobdella robusta]